MPRSQATLLTWKTPMTASARVARESSTCDRGDRHGVSGHPAVPVPAGATDPRPDLDADGLRCQLGGRPVEILAKHLENGQKGVKAG